MPDWNKLISERLGALNLPPSAQEEVVRELAAHLQDIYEEKIAEGVSETHVLEFAFKQVTNCRPLAKNIERAKHKEEIMNTRSKQFWLPALLSLTASMIWLMAIQLVAEKLHMPWRYANVAFLPYVLWIISLPVIGAASGYLSYRAGSDRRACFSAVTFPCMVMFVMWLVLVAYLLAGRIDPQIDHALSIGYGLLFWVIVPGVALVIGTLPLGKPEKLAA
jgi:hypothetical protein